MTFMKNFYWRHLIDPKNVAGNAVISIFAIALVFSTFSARQASAQPVVSETANSKGHAIIIPHRVFLTPLDAASVHLKNFPESLEGNQTLTVTAAADSDRDNRLLVTVTAENVLDDSVDAQQWLILLKPVEGGWQEYGLTIRSRCARGANAGSWKVGSCP